MSFQCHELGCLLHRNINSNLLGLISSVFTLSLLQPVSIALSLNLFKKGNSCLCVLVGLMNGRLLSAHSMTESGCQRDRAEVKGTLFQASLPPLG